MDFFPKEEVVPVLTFATDLVSGRDRCPSDLRKLPRPHQKAICMYEIIY